MVVPDVGMEVSAATSHVSALEARSDAALAFVSAGIKKSAGAGRSPSAAPGPVDAITGIPPPAAVGDAVEDVVGGGAVKGCWMTTSSSCSSSSTSGIYWRLVVPPAAASPRVGAPAFGGPFRRRPKCRCPRTASSPQCRHR